MSTTINIVCIKNRPNKVGECPLKLVICKDRKRTHQSLGIRINPLHWDFDKGQPKRSCPNIEYIRKIIADKKAAIMGTILELESENRNYTSSSLMEIQKEKTTKITLEIFFQQIMQKYTEEGKVGNLHFYKRTYNSVSTFTEGHLNIPFYESTLISGYF